MRKIFFSAILITKFIAVLSQSTSKEILRNDLIEYSWVRSKMQIIDSGILYPEYLIVMKFNKKKIKELSVLKPEEWFGLLEDSTTDWATNLFLYSVFQKDATQIVDIPEPKEFWRICCKSEDLLYWRQLLLQISKENFREKILKLKS